MRVFTISYYLFLISKYVDANIAGSNAGCL